MANFDLNAVEVNVSGIPIKDGLVSFEVAPEGDAYADEVGVDGRGCRYATGETRASCNIVLKGFSEHHAQLSALHAADRLATNGLGVGTFLLKDGNGATIISASQAWIAAVPAMTMTSKREDVTWKIRMFLTSPLNPIIAGN
jgi:hypothetical protein